MTFITKPLMAAIVAAPVALPMAASAQDGMAYETMMERMMIRQAVTEAMIDYYGSTEVVEDSGPDGQGYGDMLSGQPVPEDVMLGDVPADIASMLPYLEGAEWTAAGNHLVAVTPDDVAAVVVWEVLP